jgi:hypothetical protein
MDLEAIYEEISGNPKTRTSFGLAMNNLPLFIYIHENKISHYFFELLIKPYVSEDFYQTLSASSTIVSATPYLWSDDQYLRLIKKIKSESFEIENISTDNIKKKIPCSFIKHWGYKKTMSFWRTKNETILFREKTSLLLKNILNGLIRNKSDGFESVKTLEAISLFDVIINRHKENKWQWLLGRFSRFFPEETKSVFLAINLLTQYSLYEIPAGLLVEAYLNVAHLINDNDLSSLRECFQNKGIRFPEPECFSCLLIHKPYSIRDLIFMTYTEASLYAQDHKVKSLKLFRNWAKSERPKNFPSNPHIQYSSEWTSWGDFLGTGSLFTHSMKFMSYSEAKLYIRGCGINSQTEFNKWAKSKKRPRNFHSAPQKKYKSQWVSWGDFLGTGSVHPRLMEFMSYMEAKEYIIKCSLANQKQFKSWAKTPARPTSLPGDPYNYYKNKGWEGWTIFLKGATIGKVA